jgi:pimeloyl-ACP methyl ester carboxylesterase
MRPLIFLLAALAGAAPKPATFQAHVVGEGKPMILIPGFASSGAVWDSTVEHYRGRFQCHVLSLAGFAGQPPTGITPFLESVRRDLATYIRENRLAKPVVMGHSMGGFLALWLASAEPGLVDRLVILDALPFFAAVVSPGVTVETVQPMAQAMRRSYKDSTPDERDHMATRSIRPLVTSEADFEKVRSWSRVSDGDTMSNAMYEMLTTDLRPNLPRIDSPALIIGTWIAYREQMSRQEAEARFRAQYSSLRNYRLVLSDAARHFVMLDDPAGLLAEIDKFLIGR